MISHMQQDSPVINENCPACFEAPKERHHIKKLLSREEGMFPTLYSSLRKALLPLLDPAATDLPGSGASCIGVQTEVGRQALRQRESRKLQKNHEAHAARRASKETPLANQPLVDTERCNVADPTVKNQRLLAEGQARLNSWQSLYSGGKRRAAVGRFQADSTHLDLEAKMKTAGDKELEQDIVDLNQFCSADVCVKKTHAKSDLFENVFQSQGIVVVCNWRGRTLPDSGLFQCLSHVSPYKLTNAR